MELMDINKESKLIYQHNVITSGRYDYSACMLDILFMVLSGLEVGKLEYTIHIQDIETITGRKWNLKQLREATESIGSRMFEIDTPESLEQIWLFSKVKYLKGTGSFTVKLNDEATPYFFDLKNNFTALQLKSVLNCSSKYAKRLYSIACQWRSVGSKRFEIVELKKMLGLIDKNGNEQFERISDFKKFVLDIARTQISENTDIELDYELKKRGREFYWVSSVALRTPGLISSTKISSTNQAASAKISTSPHSSCSPILMSASGRCPAARRSCQLQAVAQPAVGQDQIGLGVPLPQLGAQGLDVSVDGAIQALFGPAPHQIHQLLAGVDPARCLHERLEQQVFVAGEGQGLTVEADAGPLLVQCQQLARLGDYGLAAA